MTTETTRPAIAYAMPIGGGWAHFCTECFEAHKDDEGSDPDAVADCESIIEIEHGAVISCEICHRVAHGSAGFADVEAAIRRISDATIGRRENPIESAVLRELESIMDAHNG